MERLHQRNIKVFLISGGFRCIVEHVATQLNIPLHHVYANRLKFYFNGMVIGIVFFLHALYFHVVKVNMFQVSMLDLMKASQQLKVVEREK